MLNNIYIFAFKTSKTVSQEKITHNGVIQSIRDNLIRVSIMTQSGCVSCKMNKVCNPSEVQEKIIEVKSFDTSLSVGDQVVVSIEETAGIKALVIAYVVPFFIVLAALIVFSQITDNEGIAGLLSLAILLPYFLLLFIFKSKLKKQFSFFIHKQQ